MNEEELSQALLPVKKFFTAKELTKGTVLAAYLRRLGIRPTGANWMAAQAALGSGMSFEQAAELAKELSGPLDAPNDGSRVKPSLRSSAMNRQRAEETAPISEREIPNRSRIYSSDATFPRLEWFPKRTTAGDMDGEGLQKLLGAPGHDNLSVLVRETAQNSWDARDKRKKPNLKYVLRQAEPHVIDWLRRNFRTPANIRSGLHIQESLERPKLRLLEISDRGTIGLGGPTRNDRKIPDDVPRDYVNLVLNIGVPRDVDKGGGTYGFGKIATYRASRCRTAIIWTRCATPNGPEHRLIAVSLGQSFDNNGRMHTGHHWWGRIISEVGEDDRVEPLTGEDAERVGGLLFSTPFNDDFGTSILVVDPDVEDSETGKLRDQEIVDVIQTHLWPKIHLDPSGERPMPISLEIDGEKLSLEFDISDLAYKAYGKALNAIRTVQSDTSHSSHVMRGIEINELWSQRPKRLLGHLAVVSYPRSHIVKNSPLSKLPVNSICLMRHTAELVVKYEVHSALPEQDLEWCAVFKPTETTDDAFADSEPPAHDDWLPESLDNKEHRTFVNVSKRERRNKIAAYLQPLVVQNTTGLTSVPTGQLANALSWLVPQNQYSNGLVEPKRGGKTKRRGTRKAGSISVLKQERKLSSESNLAEVTLTIRLEEDAGTHRYVEIISTAKTETGNEIAEEISCDWIDWSEVGGQMVLLGGGEVAQVRITFPRYLLVEVEFEVHAEDKN